MFKKVLPFTLLAGSALLTGCASSMGLGNSEFGCSGYPAGVQCMSTKDMYALTEQPGAVTAEQAIEYQQQTGKHPMDESSEHDEEPLPSAPSNLSEPHLLSQSPISDKAVPIRTRSKVMRIWVAPWESGDGDLQVSGLVFTELEERRWNIGVPHEKGPVELKPLNINKPAAASQ